MHDSIDYDEVGLRVGLEVHQQLLTDTKMFCHCPAGLYTETHDGSVLRHMRPTLSELGEYDGTALMEFRTKKEIVYRIKNETACTYEVDDTPQGDDLVKNYISQRVKVTGKLRTEDDMRIIVVTAFEVVEE